MVYYSRNALRPAIFEARPQPRLAGLCTVEQEAAAVHSASVQLRLLRQAAAAHSANGQLWLLRRAAAAHSANGQLWLLRPQRCQYYHPTGYGIPIYCPTGHYQPRGQGGYWRIRSSCFNESWGGDFCGVRSCFSEGWGGDFLEGGQG